MHTAAAWYPEKPSSFEQQAASNLVQSLAALYPCTHCVEDFREAVKESPPRVESRSAFATWLCQQHNLVNKKLGKVRQWIMLDEVTLNFTLHCYCWRLALSIIFSVHLVYLQTEFDCSLANIDQRWRIGHPSCYGKADETSSESLGQS